MRYAQLVIGPAGCGKSTYCHTLVQHGVEIKKNIKVVNLDPAAEHFQYNPLVDIRELIQVQDTMEDEDLQFGPNGGLVFCIEYLLENSDWLRDKIGDQDEDYILFDCPGQIELYMHLTAMKKLAKQLQNWEFSICCVYIIDVQFMTDPFKFISGAMSALSVMVNLELPHVNILSKMDLLSKSAKKRLESVPPSDYDTIFSVLSEVADDNKDRISEQNYYFVTFDQPLYLKAREILACEAESNPNKLANIIARIGSIGFIMEGSGLKEALCKIYAENSVDKIIQGIAYSRAVRGHLLIHVSLSNIIFSSMEIDDVDRARVEVVLNTLGFENFSEN
nr:GPN-loop GTPase 3 [Leptinotarsa decemlineata]